MFRTIIQPIQRQFSCRTPMSRDAASLQIALHDEDTLPPADNLEGPYVIVQNAMRENGVTCHDAMTMLILLSVYGNPGFAHALTYSLACEAFRQRTTHISARVLVGAFGMGMPSPEQLGEYWDIFKAGKGQAAADSTEHLLRPTLMLRALIDADVAIAGLTDDQILDLYLNLDDAAGDENYALPAD